MVKPNWNRLFSELLIIARKQVGSISELMRLCSVNLVQGRKMGAGYHYLPEIDISVQGMSANDAALAIVTVARRLNIELEIHFMWFDKDGAAHPGEERCLRIRRKS